MIAGRSWSKKRSKGRQRSALCPFILFGTWISAAREVIISLPYPSLRLPLPGTFETSLLRRMLWPQISLHIFCGLKMVIPPTRKLGKRSRKNSIAETLSKLAKTLPPPPVSTYLALRLIFGAKTLSWLLATTAIKKVTMRTTIPSPRKMLQKTRSSFGDLHVGNWG